MGAGAVGAMGAVGALRAPATAAPTAWSDALLQLLQLEIQMSHQFSPPYLSAVPSAAQNRRDLRDLRFTASGCGITQRACHGSRTVSIARTVEGGTRG